MSYAEITQYFLDIEIKHITHKHRDYTHHLVLRYSKTLSNYHH